jgi:CheY-like chemotaxis protein
MSLEGLEVTAFHPASGRSKVLSHEELEELSHVLDEYDAALRSGKENTRDLFWARFDALGLDIGWYFGGGPGAKTLFKAKAGNYERDGTSLQELLETIKTYRKIKASQAPSAPGSKLVFVVDDDDTLRDLTLDALRAEGFQTQGFANGLEALEAVHQAAHGKLPDLIVLDLMMPAQGGFETIKALQASEASRAPIIMVTGRKLDPKMADTLRHEPNVVEFLKKPVTPSDLARIAHQTLGTTPRR